LRGITLVLLRAPVLVVILAGPPLVAITVARGVRAQDWEAHPEDTAPPPTPEPVAETALPATSGGGLDVELAAQASYVTPPIRGGANPFGAGFGGRVGLVYSGFYVGASVLDFLGGSNVDVSYRAVLYGLEVGYGLRFPAFGGGSFTLRPQVGLGDAVVYYTDPTLAADVVTSASGSSSASADTLTVNNVYVEPALLAMLSSGGHFVAARAGALVIPGIQYGGADATTWVCTSGQLQLGFVF
jgi:hypothetical protein